MEKHFREMMEQVNMSAVFKARRVVQRVLPPTLLARYERLCADWGTDIYVKHENHLPTNSFKVRGAVNFMAHATPQVARSGIVVATRGNHGMAVAWAARDRGIFCNVVVPEGNDAEMNAEIASYGAQLIIKGADFYEAQDYCEELAENAGYYYLRQGNDPHLIAGTAVMGLEIFEELPEVDTILMPIGGGTGCAALATVIRGINPRVELIGVQAHNVPSFYESWKRKEKVTVPMKHTVADGLAARSVFEVPFLLLKDVVSDVVLLTEEELLEGVRMALRYTHNLAEVAGAAALAAAYKIRDRLAGKKVVVVMTGGNITYERLEKILAQQGAG
ncbi:MAG: threonine ammonia-lyase [Desulfosoma sp.]|uniref:threonine ammonia-lyase n=1 Tax=Desulfosoma sp. TaxID=2603217 RepID=UPI004049AC6B